MPAGPGETLLTTVYADVHYLFRAAAPSHPQHHRFAKGSYVYLYYSATDRRAKLEIANHAGTPDQDAFYGYLDAAQNISYSSKHPTLCSILLDQPRIKTQAEWHLVTWDERNEKRWAHKLHTVDLYFWTERDASSFVNQLKATIPGDKLDLGDVPAARQTTPAEHRDSMSPVVQQLEHTAIGAHFPPRAGSTTSAQSLPGPPTPASTNSLPPPPPPSQQVAPAAYNPAAPAAPEPISYREKTPPPPDGANGNGLAEVAKYDGQQQQYPGMTQYAPYSQQGAPSLQNTPQSSYFPGPPQAATPVQQRQASFGPEAVAPVQQRQASFGPESVAPVQNRQPSFGPQTGAPNQQYQQSFGPQAGASYGSHVASPGVTSPGLPPTPGAPPAYMSLPPPPSTSSPVQHSGQQPQVAGFSSYSYSPSPSTPAAPAHYSPAGGFTGNVHSQVYRPTEGEAAHGHGHSKTAHTQPTGDHQDKLSERFNKLEKGLGGFLKRLDKF